MYHEPEFVRAAGFDLLPMIFSGSSLEFLADLGSPGNFLCSLTHHYGIAYGETSERSVALKAAEASF